MKTSISRSLAGSSASWLGAQLGEHRAPRAARLLGGQSINMLGSCSSFCPVATLPGLFKPSAASTPRAFSGSRLICEECRNKVISSPPVKSFLSFPIKEPGLRVLSQAEAFILQMNCPRDCFILNVSVTLPSYLILVCAPVLYKYCLPTKAGWEGVCARLTRRICWRVDIDEKWHLTSRAAFLL